MLSTTSDLDAGVADADAVLLQLRVGGQAARVQDETWPLECGCVGPETTGAGGMAEALRTAPVVLEIASRVRKASPDVWTVDFTDPVGIVTRALLEQGHEAVGLFNAALSLQRRFAALLGSGAGAGAARPRRPVPLDPGAAGPRRRRGPLPELLDRRLDEIADEVGLPAWLLSRLAVVPSSYLRYFSAHDGVVRELSVAKQVLREAYPAHD